SLGGTLIPRARASSRPSPDRSARGLRGGKGRRGGRSSDGRRCASGGDRRAPSSRPAGRGRLRALWADRSAPGRRAGPGPPAGPLLRGERDLQVLDPGAGLVGKAGAALPVVLLVDDLEDEDVFALL